MDGLDYWKIPAGLKNVTITSSNYTATFPHKPHVSIFSSDGYQLTGYSPEEIYGSYGEYGYMWWNTYVDPYTGTATMNGLATGQDIIDKDPKALFDSGATYDKSLLSLSTKTHNGISLEILKPQTEAPGDEVIHIDELTENLVFIIGGHDNIYQGCNVYNLTITAEVSSSQNDIVHNLTISTQESAQKMLADINFALISKDKIRAHLGAIQNRLENTISNMSIQSENLQASESRISDIDVGIEMTNLVKKQILTQSAIAMLSQANTLPHMALNLING